MFLYELRTKIVRTSEPQLLPAGPSYCTFEFKAITGLSCHNETLFSLFARKKLGRFSIVIFFIQKSHLFPMSILELSELFNTNLITSKLTEYISSIVGHPKLKFS